MEELTDVKGLMARRGSDDRSFQDYCADPAVAATGWPPDVLEQWPFDHWRHSPFKDDYGAIDPQDVVWCLEMVTAEELSKMPTGETDAGRIEEVAEHPDHYAGNRGLVSLRWETNGTWVRPPILIDRRLLNPPGSGLQVVEGRTRVGVLRGRLLLGKLVAPKHRAWIGRPAGVLAHG